VSAWRLFAFGEHSTWMRSLFAPARVRPSGGRFGQIHFVHLSVKRSTANAELFSRCGDIAIGRGKRLGNQMEAVVAHLKRAGFKRLKSRRTAQRDQPGIASGPQYSVKILVPRLPANHAN